MTDHGRSLDAVVGGGEPLAPCERKRRLLWRKGTQQATIFQQRRDGYSGPDEPPGTSPAIGTIRYLP